jgi:hypothetical protein
MTNDLKLELYWMDIPVGKENAVDYFHLMEKWQRSERDVRKILHQLSMWDNGDDYVLIRSSKNRGGFYRTQDAADMEDYKEECLNKGRSIFAPVKKINRILNANSEQISLTNNLRVYREISGLLQPQVCDRMKQFDESFDVPMLSKMENGVCLPTWQQCKHLAEIYRCQPSELIRYDVFCE